MQTLKNSKEKVKNKHGLVQWFIITTFVSLYLIVSVISTIHVIDFFKLSNPEWLAVSLAIAFEIGASASLASLIVLNKMNRTLVWVLFFVLTAMQMMGNSYFAFSHVHDYQSWVELFGLVDEDPLYQKRILSIISGAILPLVALGFIKSLVDYIKPNDKEDLDDNKEIQKIDAAAKNTSDSIEEPSVVEKTEKIDIIPEETTEIQNSLQEELPKAVEPRSTQKMNPQIRPGVNS
jgi:hypothetical protein